MNRRVLVIAPHPDDETLGCGGTILRHVAEGDEVHWCIVTAMHSGDGWPLDRIHRREQEISAVSSAFRFASTTILGFRAGRLDEHPMADVVSGFGGVLDRISPDVLYLPHRADAHSDHRISFAAAVAASKIFRRPGLARILSYETISETDVVPAGSPEPFRPEFFVDIQEELEPKLSILSLYEGEILPPPFPRSLEAVRAQALLRGGQCGCPAAEAFMVLRDVWRRNA